MKNKKIFLIPLLAALAVGCAPNTGPTSAPTSNPTSEPTSTPTVEPTSAPIEEGKLYIRNYVQYLTYNPTRIQKMMDKVDTPDLDLYYFIVDETVATIENDHIIPHKVGTTQVFASTASGQEVEFSIDVQPDENFIYNRDVNSVVEAFKTKAGSPKNPTLFIGDSFFDVNNFWLNFYNDFEGYPVASMGISGSQTTHQMICRDKLIKQFNPKNIVLHIGTNDVNDTSVAKTSDQYYETITEYLSTLCEEYADVNIYYLGIENRNNAAGAKNAYVERVTAKIKDEFAPAHSNFTYIDSPSVFNLDLNKYISSDDIHPSEAGRQWYVEQLKEIVNW